MTQLHQLEKVHVLHVSWFGLEQLSPEPPWMFLVRGAVPADAVIGSVLKVWFGAASGRGRGESHGPLGSVVQLWSTIA